MATPYLQFRHQTVSSTQDLARNAFQRLPVLVSAIRQTKGRGRTGSSWSSAPHATAVSYARAHVDDERPVSLMAGIAAARVLEQHTRSRLKWPNDVMLNGEKLGGILVEIASGLAVVGLGINLHWPGRPPGTAHLSEREPSEGLSHELAALWGAELNRLWDSEGWAREEYVDRCETIGREVTWDGGQGRAVDVDESGALLVETADGLYELRSGSVRHLRSSDSGA